MPYCYLALGSNLNSPSRQIRLAIQRLDSLSQSCVLKASPIYKSIPAEVRQIQPVYFNAVIKLKTKLRPTQLLQLTQEIEKKMKRTHKGFKQPRTIDIDILLFDKISMTSHSLQIPHPRMHQRDFVLKPLLDINPEIMIPKYGSAKRCLAQIMQHHCL